MLLWYAGYGSNLDPARFARYLTGGRPDGAARTAPGARDPAPPRAERAVTLPGGMFFAWESPTWGGGISFYDAAADDRTLARAYLLTAEQFTDVAAQEMHREPGGELDLTRVLAERSHALGPGRYETLHLVGELDGSPMLTFTAAEPDRLRRNPPTPAYLGTVARGLAQTHGLPAAAIADYLLARPGMTGWSRADVERVAGEARAALPAP